MSLEINNNNKKNYYEITTKPLKPRLKRLNVKGNRVIKLFILKCNYYIALLPKVLILTSNIKTIIALL